VVILATFAEGVDDAEARTWKPTVVRVDAQNRILADDGAAERPGPARALFPIA
jgi:aspartate 1-decarboxylase